MSPAAIIAATLHGVADKIKSALGPAQPEKLQITLQGADDLYREIRVPNRLQHAHRSHCIPV